MGANPLFFPPLGHVWWWRSYLGPNFKPPKSSSNKSKALLFCPPLFSSAPPSQTARNDFGSLVDQAGVWPAAVQRLRGFQTKQGGIWKSPLPKHTPNPTPPAPACSQLCAARFKNRGDKGQIYRGDLRPFHYHGTAAALRKCLCRDQEPQTRRFFLCLQDQEPNHLIHMNYLDLCWPLLWILPKQGLNI